ncbi:unnamed protein product [Rotaria sp. Silwood2]|nr:unnamed protein product [Rotaria sp. Silwood2]
MHHEGSDRLGFSDLLVIVIALVRSITNVAFLGPFVQLLEEARGALAPVFRLIDEEKNTTMNEIQISQSSVSSAEVIDINGDIRFDNVSFAYPVRSDVLALRNLTLTARAGETTALVGSSGSGSSGAICNRLSSDALAVQQMVGSYLGIVFESFATFGVGIIFGLWFNWQLALTVLSYIVFLFVLAFMQIHWQARLNKRCDDVLGLASSLAVEVIHNMRTVKQLASEAEFLRQFSDLIFEQFNVPNVTLYCNENDHPILSQLISFNLIIFTLCDIYSIAYILRCMPNLSRFYFTLASRMTAFSYYRELLNGFVWQQLLKRYVSCLSKFEFHISILKTFSSLNLHYYQVI